LIVAGRWHCAFNIARYEFFLLLSTWIFAIPVGYGCSDQSVQWSKIPYILFLGWPLMFLLMGRGRWVSYGGDKAGLLLLWLEVFQGSA
jgi:hypothetical protein